MSPSGLTVVIPTRDRPAFLDACLKTIIAAIAPGDECIVVDSASTESGVQHVAETHGARYIRTDTPGASLARNIGWRAAQHDLIAFVDDDVLVHQEWAANLKATFSEHPDAAFVSGRILRPEETHGEFFAPATENETSATIDARSDLDPGHSANLAVRRDALEAVDGFDELLGAGARFRAAEDRDLFDRLFGLGLWGRYEITVPVTHSDWREREHARALHWSYGIGTGARLGKLIKTDRTRARRVAREALWEWGLHDIYKQILRRYRFLTVLGIVRTAGMIVGLARAAPYEVVSGHYRPR